MSIDMLAFWTPGPVEMIVIAAVGLIVFGNRLPEVGRSLGKSIVEFKKGIKGVKDELDTTDRDLDAKASRKNDDADSSRDSNGYSKES